MFQFFRKEGDSQDCKQLAEHATPPSEEDEKKIDPCGDSIAVGDSDASQELLAESASPATPASDAGGASSGHGGPVDERVPVGDQLASREVSEEPSAEQAPREVVPDVEQPGVQQSPSDIEVGENLEMEALVGHMAAREVTGVPLPLDGTAKLAARARGRGRRLVAPEKMAQRQDFTAEQRLLLLDTWLRSGLPAGDFAALVGISKHTLYTWKKRFKEQGPAGLADQPRGTKRGSRLPELTRRAILMLKESNPEWGCQRISDMLTRGPALPASASAVARVLHEAGYELVEEKTRSHPDKVRRFERAKANQLWQTDLFTFVLKRQNRRVYLVAFLDDHSRFIVSFGLHASQSTALVLEVLEAGLSNYGPPEEILTDNGAQYVTWRGKSQFTKELEKRGIRQIVARPRRPQTLGKIERFWGSLWRECVQSAVFLDLADARRRIGLFIDYYNFSRVHRGIEGLVPADRFFQAAPEVLNTLKQRVAANALELARHGVPKQRLYLTGQVDGKPFSVHREGDRVVLRRGAQQREEIELAPDEQSRDACQAEPSAAEGAAQTVPEPICPDGSPQASPGEPASKPPLLPGQSALDQASGSPEAADPDSGAEADDEAADVVGGDEDE